MKPTKIFTLIGWVVPGATAGYLFAKVATANGAQVPVAPVNLILTLAAISIILLGFALPMLRYRRALAEQLKNPAAPRPKRLNPFYAVRLLLLAKSSAIYGSLFAGWQVGVIWMQLTSPVTTDSIWQNAGALLAAIILVVIGLIVERICRIKDDGAEPLEGPVTKAPATGQIAGKISSKTEKSAR